MISSKGKYAIRVMVDLAINSNGKYITLKDISSRENISYKYVEQVVAILLRASLVQSFRGNNGGYRLTKKPDEYTLFEIIKATEGNIGVNILNDDPVYEKNIFIDLNNIIKDKLQGITLLDIINKINQDNNFGSYI